MYYYSCKDGEDTIVVSSDIELADPCGAGGKGTGITGKDGATGDEDDNGDGTGKGSIGFNPFGLFTVSGKPLFTPPDWLKKLFLILVIALVVFLVIKIKK